MIGFMPIWCTTLGDFQHLLSNMQYRHLSPLGPYYSLEGKLRFKKMNCDIKATCSKHYVAIWNASAFYCVFGQSTMGYKIGKRGLGVSEESCMIWNLSRSPM